MFPFTACAAVQALPVLGPFDSSYTFEHVCDSNTIRVVGVKIRLVLIDAPESSGNQ